MDTAPARQPHRLPHNGPYLCSAAADCNLEAVIQWSYEITADNLAAMRTLLAIPYLKPGDTVPVFACADHQ
jgi:hypothetical protein